MKIASIDAVVTEILKAEVWYMLSTFRAIVLESLSYI